MKLNKLSRDAADTAPRADLVAERYLVWRRHSRAVSESYRSWTRADRNERPLAFAGYLRALDGEEHAAAAYQDLIERSRPA